MPENRPQSAGEHSPENNPPEEAHGNIPGDASALHQNKSALVLGEILETGFLIGMGTLAAVYAVLGHLITFLVLSYLSVASVPFSITLAIRAYYPNRKILAALCIFFFLLITALFVYLVVTVVFPSVTGGKLATEIIEGVSSMSHPKFRRMMIFLGLLLTIVLWCAIAYAIRHHGQISATKLSPVPPPARPAARPATLSAEQKATFGQLRHSFELLAVQSKGLHHVLVERQTGFGIPRDGDDAIPMIVRVEKVLHFDNPPNEPTRPRALSNAEIAAAPAPQAGDRYIRDRHQRPLAIWENGVQRSAYIFGDHSVVPQYQSVSDGAGNALLSVPDDAVSLMPDYLRPLFRQGQNRRRRYVFGKIPENVTLPQHSMEQGWQPAGLVFDEGVVIDCTEISSRDDRGAVWGLLLHRLGWNAQVGSMLHASQWHWRNNVSVSVGHDLHKVMPGVTVPTHRFYSVLSLTSDAGTDICYASVWAIDELLKLLA
jgi:hypothetical protein